MNRKHFLSSFLVAGLPLRGSSAWVNDDDDKEAPAPILPHYLKPGDTIGITCPAGSITLEEI